MAQEITGDNAEHWYQESAAQHDLGRKAEAVIRLGLMLMGAGTAGYRVIRGMKRAARALGFDALDAVVGVNSITCTFKKGERFRTMVAVQQKPGINASRIEALEDLTHHLHHRITVEDLNTALDFIEDNINERFHPAVMVGAAGVACAAFAVLNHYDWAEIPVVAVAAALGQWTRIWLTRKNFNQLGTVALAGAAASLSYFLVTVLLEYLGYLGDDARNFAAGYVAAALFLIPGFPLFSSLLDLSRFDITAGVARMTYAVSVIVTATISVGMVSAITGLNPLPQYTTVPLGEFIPIAAVASFLGVAGFSILFQSSRRMVVTAAAVGTVGNLVRLLLIDNEITQQYAAFVAGCLIGLIAAAMAAMMRIPRITVTVPAAVIMIPGVAIYKSMYFLNTYDMERAISHAADAALVVVFITAGLAAARMMTDPNWTFGRLIDFSKPLRPEDDIDKPPATARAAATVTHLQKGSIQLLSEVTTSMRPTRRRENDK